MKLNPLSTLLTQNKLDGDSYVDWKCNLDMVLTTDKYKWALFTPCHAAPTTESSNEQLIEYEKWKQSDEMAKCYILGSMSNVLQEQHHSMETVADIMSSVDEMFSRLARRARFEATYAFMNLRQKK